ncbi:MAG: TIGR03936 family radical SAM-associated protein [Planctomycetes bacterium]|nr:TIGR03936 family radical SAM-associated protein [Planctomycetota bacterium]
MTRDFFNRERIRVRFRFSKRGDAKHMSHLDLAAVFEKALRRTGLPTSYTSGFNPRICLSFVSAASTSMECLREVFEVEFEDRIDVDGITEKVNLGLPAGVRTLSASCIPLKSKGRPTFFDYSARGAGWNAENMRTNVRGFLASESVPVTSVRKSGTKTNDIRRSVSELGFEDDELYFRVLDVSGHFARPDELFRALGLEEGKGDVDLARLDVGLADEEEGPSLTEKITSWKTERGRGGQEIRFKDKVEV